MTEANPTGTPATHMPPASRPQLALAGRGAWGQVAVAATLITILPSLILLWAWVSGEAPRSPGSMALAFGSSLFFILLGYALLLKYPASITHLRRYLKCLAQDQLPAHVDLPHDEDDLNAIRQYLETIVKHAEERIRLLEDKHEADLAAERHRIMTESVGALCHHVGQPAAALGITLHLMQQATPSPALAALVAESQRALEELSSILDRLRDLTHYRTEPYLASDPAGARIISLPPPPSCAKAATDLRPA